MDPSIKQINFALIFLPFPQNLANTSFMYVFSMIFRTNETLKNFNICKHGKMRFDRIQVGDIKEQ